MIQSEVRVTGLKEFQRALKKVDKDLPKAMRLALNESANVVVASATPLIPRRSGRAARSVKARSTQTLARVQGGGGRAEYYPWLDFGGAVGRRNATRRPFLPKGRYIYPAFFANRDRFRSSLEDALVNVARSAGVEVS